MKLFLPQVAAHNRVAVLVDAANPLLHALATQHSWTSSGLRVLAMGSLDPPTHDRCRLVTNITKGLHPLPVGHAVFA